MLSKTLSMVLLVGFCAFATLPACSHKSHDAKAGCADCEKKCAHGDKDHKHEGEHKCKSGACAAE